MKFQIHYTVISFRLFIDCHFRTQIKCVVIILLAVCALLKLLICRDVTTQIWSICIYLSHLQKTIKQFFKIKLSYYLPYHHVSHSILEAKYKQFIPANTSKVHQEFRPESRKYWTDGNSTTEIHVLPIFSIYYCILFISNTHIYIKRWKHAGKKNSRL